MDVSRIASNAGAGGAAGDAGVGQPSTAARRAEVESVLERFAAAWAHPDVDRFVELLHRDVRLLQPVVDPIVGREAARREFTRLLAWLPDLRGTVDESAIAGDTGLVAWRLVFSLGGAPYELRIVDRLVVQGGLIREREAYYDSLGLMVALLRRPSAWLGYWRYRGYLPWTPRER